MRRCGLAIALLLACGCSSDGPQRYRVSGSVTYGDAPVVAGRVIFEPDVEQGNHGPAGYADIRQGRYQTLNGKGVIGGQHKVRVICLTGVPEGEELAEGRMLCPEYQATIDLPKSGTTHDIAVPEDWQW